MVETSSSNTNRCGRSQSEVGKSHVRFEDILDANDYKPLSLKLFNQYIFMWGRGGE